MQAVGKSITKKFTRMKQWLMLCVLPGQLMGEVFVTVPFAKSIPKFMILYHSCQKNNRTIKVFQKRLFDFFKTHICIIIKLLNDLKTITYDSFAITPLTRIC